jgi:hypothetical protein
MGSALNTGYNDGCKAFRLNAGGFLRRIFSVGFAIWTLGTFAVFALLAVLFLIRR